jgi:hypothetical protein
MIDDVQPDVIIDDKAEWGDRPDYSKCIFLSPALGCDMAVFASIFADVNSKGNRDDEVHEAIREHEAAEALAMPDAEAWAMIRAVARWRYSCGV